MRLSAMILVCLFLVGCAGAPKHLTWSNAAGSEQHERLMWQAIHDQDWTNVGRHLSPTFIGVNPQGQMLDRTGWIEYWKSAQPVEFSLGEVLVYPEGADMKVTSIVQFKSAGAGKSVRAVSIWQQVKKRWTLTATSLTPIQN
jgi:Domain of unknown function (DUF4440)